MYVLQNEYLRAEVNCFAEVVSLSDAASGGKNIIETPSEGFFAVLAFRDRERLENCVSGRRQNWRVSGSDNSVLFETDSLVYSDGLSDDNVADASVKLKIALDGENLLFTAEVDNRTDAYFTDLEFPRLGELKSPDGSVPTLYAPLVTGAAITNPGERLSHGTSRESENNTLGWTYPGPVMSMQWIALCGKESCLFFEGNDPDFSACEFRLEGRLNGAGAMTLVYDRYAAVCPRSRLSLSPFKVKLHRGDWRRGVADYAEWIKPYRPQHVRPDWIMDMQGYFLVINKQQFGYDMWPYDTLPKLYELAEAHGFDTLGLFGWYESGHDNRYPDLEVSTTLGGAEKLKAGIKEVQAKGGHVTLYYQGHLIDVNSDFFKNGGDACAAKTIWNNEYIEYYNKSHKSGYLRTFSRKRFAIACPSSAKWRDLMVSREDWMASFGADGTLYDQIGGCNPYLCFADDHDHDGGSPARAFSGGRQKLMGALQSRSKEIGPEFCFMTENVVDLYSTYTDCLHSFGVQSNGRGELKAAAERPESPRTVYHPEIFRSAFPEVKVTIRNAAPFMSERDARYAFLHSFIFEQEIRYLADKDDILADKFAPQREYSKKVADFRKEYWDILGRGDYVDDKYATSSNLELYAESFETADRVAVTLWNDSSAPAELSALTIDKALKPVLFATPDGESETVPETLAPDEIAVIILKK